MLINRISLPWRVAGSGLAAALALSLLVAFTPGGQTAAASFLAQFRSRGVTAVEITPQTQGDIVRTMNALGNLGTVQTPALAGQPPTPNNVARGAAAQRKTASLAEATTAVGFPIETPDPASLPPGIDKTPLVELVPASQIRFTFDNAKARAYLQTSGHGDVNVPDKFDGATLVVSIPAAALLQYGNTSTRDVLIIGEAGELVVDVEGGKVGLTEMRDFLLGLPGLPPGVVSQLRQMNSWNDTLPIPIPVDKVTWRSTRFNGNDGLLLDDNSGAGSAAIWHATGRLYGIAGSIKAIDLEQLASTLKVRN